MKTAAKANLQLSIEFGQFQKELSKHDRIQLEILSTCNKLGINAFKEYRGSDWRADIFIPSKKRPVAIEVQLSPQSLKRTLERQEKYIRDGITACWFFERPVSKLNEERPQLPLFYVDFDQKLGLLVYLGNRRVVSLSSFIENFVNNNIQFKPIAVTSQLQKVDIVFYEMNCWNCGEMNHLYYVDKPFLTACHAKIKPDESMWESNAIEYRPEIKTLAQSIVEGLDVDIRLGEIKKRYSKTVDDSYLSFGCYSCDSIFGDWYVMEAKLELMYEDITPYQGEIELTEIFEVNVPHWCFPDNGQFCDH